MYRVIIILIACLCLIGCEPEGPRRLSLASKVTSDEGWQGKRYYDNADVLSEEFDTVGNDGRIDLWRFYEKGKLLVEERDRNGDGLLDYVINFDPVTEQIRAFRRDSDFDGKMDLWVHYESRNRWLQRRDRSGNGTADWYFRWTHGPEALQLYVLDPLTVTDMHHHVPPKNWLELGEDTNGDGHINQWFRYRNGEVLADGIDLDQDGEPERWQLRRNRAPVSTGTGVVSEETQSVNTWTHDLTPTSPTPVAQPRAAVGKVPPAPVDTTPAPTPSVPERAPVRGVRESEAHAIPVHKYRPRGRHPSEDLRE